MAGTSGMRLAAAVAGSCTVCAGPALGAEAIRSIFGVLPDGQAVPAVTLANSHGMSATVIAYGATLQSFVMPDRAGDRADITLGHATIDEYLAKPQYFGSTVGRFANRIARGRFSLDGRDFQTPVNNGVNALHGGAVGFDKVVWNIVEVTSGPSASVTLRHVSADGDQGYPGEMTVDAVYSLDETDTLTIEYRAATTAPTIVNITNHAYWSLSGEGSRYGAMGTLLTIPADRYLPTDEGAIPTGEIRSVSGTVFDFRKPKAIGEGVRDARDEQIRRGRGYDHNWVFGLEVTPEQHLMAKAFDPLSGRGFELWSNQPGLQFYSGNFLDGTSSGKAGGLYRQGDAFALEPQIFPDTPNQPKFGSARLSPGVAYRNVMSYRFRTTGE